MANESVFQDLIGFLKSERADLRISATEATLGTTDRYAIMNFFITREKVILIICCFLFFG